MLLCSSSTTALSLSLYVCATFGRVWYLCIVDQCARRRPLLLFLPRTGVHVDEQKAQDDDDEACSATLGYNWEKVAQLRAL